MTHDRDEVKADYMDATIAALGGDWGQLHTGHIVRSMADEIVRLRKENAIVVSMLTDQIPLLNRLQDTVDALREPSEAVMIAVQDAVYDQVGAPCHYREATVIVRAAATAAEQEATS